MNILRGEGWDVKTFRAGRRHQGADRYEDGILDALIRATSTSSAPPPTLEIMDRSGRRISEVKFVAGRKKDDADLLRENVTCIFYAQNGGLPIWLA